MYIYILCDLCLVNANTKENKFQQYFPPRKMMDVKILSNISNLKVKTI